MTAALPQPLIADVDFPWVIVAMIFIMFFRWLTDRLGKRFGESGEDEDFTRFETEQEVRETTGRASPPPPPVQGSDAPAQQLKRFLETIAEGIEVQPQAPAPQAPSPAPARTTPPPAPRTEPSDAQRRAAHHYQEVMAARRRHRPPTTGHPLHLNPQTLRQAIILKEVLDAPRALREDW